MVHVQPAKDPYKAFGAPTLEYCVFTLLEGHSESKAALQGYVEELVNAVLGLGEDVIDAIVGSVVEKPESVAMLIGWTSVEVSKVRSDDLVPQLK